MKKFYRNLLLMAAVFFMTLFLSTEASATSLEEQVDLEHLAHYLQQEANAGTILIDVEEFQIPIEYAPMLEMTIDKILQAEGISFRAVYFSTEHTPYVMWMRVATSTAITQKNEAVDILLRGIAGNDTLSDMEKALLIHDRLAVWMRKAGGSFSPSSDYTIVALTNKASHSLGYAQAYQHLLWMVDIPSDVYLSSAAGHAWNGVWLGDTCYMVDVYMDDSDYMMAGPEVIHDYFFAIDDTNTWRGEGYGTEYRNVFWPDRVYLLDGGLYGVTGADFCRVDDTVTTPITIPGVSHPYQLVQSLEVDGTLLCYDTTQLFSLDIKTGAKTYLWNATDSITGLDYHEGRIACVVNGSWVYPFASTTYTMTFRNWDSSVLQSTTCEFGQIVKPPAAPDRAGYNFADWSWKTQIICTGDETLTARFTPCQFPDGWFEENGKRFYRENDHKKIGWHQEDDKTYYFGITGQLKTGLFSAISPTDGNSESYYADADGVLQTGWKQLDGYWYFFSPAAETLWSQINGKWYFFNIYGQMQTGWFYQNDKTYYLDENTGMVVGWKQIATVYGNDWYYFGADGNRVAGWQKIGNQWYYFDPTQGNMETGWLKQNGFQYYLRESGAMAVGWQKVGYWWHYFDPSGNMVTGWKLIGGKWYYFRPDDYASGEMATGMWLIGNKHYYFGSDGAMRTGWVNANGNWMYFDSSGAQVTGWLKSGNTWYYLNGKNDGKMVTDFRTIDGVKYYFGSDGAMRTGWFTVPQAFYSNGSLVYVNRWYYANASGAIQTGWLKQGNVWYYLLEGGAMATGRIRIGNQWYHFADNGVWIP